MQVVGAHDATLDLGITAQEVKGKAFGEDVAEVEGEAPGQGLQAEHTQQFGGTGFDLEELAALNVGLHAAREAGGVQSHGRADPADLAGDLPLPAAHGVGFAKAAQQQPGVLDGEVETQRGAASV